MVKAAVVEIDGADRRLAIVADKDLCVDEAGSVLKYLDARGYQTLVVGFCEGVSRLFIRYARQDQLDVYSALCGIF